MGLEHADRLDAYVPRLVIDWLRHEPTVEHRRIPGTAVFADISGFTQLTEILGGRGKIGAEEMGDILNALFEELLADAYEYGAGLVKWGGDAVLLLFEDDGHAARACQAAAVMQRTVRRAGRVKTSCGPVRLRMSIGIHTGEIDFFLVGRHYRELIMTGPAATTVALMEKAAEADQVVVSDETRSAVVAVGAQVDVAKGPGWLLGRPPPGVAPCSAPAVEDPPDLAEALPPALRDHILGGTVDSEHRHVAVGFLEFWGADALADADQPGALEEAVRHLVDACQAAAEASDVTILSTDVNVDGGKVIFISGAPRRAGADEARVLTALRAVLDAGGPLSLRAGANCGRVFAGDFGPSYRRNYSVAGDCVNLAARLMATAAPGQLLATESVVERAGDRFSTSPVPPFKVRGKQELVRARTVEPARAARTRVGSDAVPLVGRERELGLLLDAAKEVQRSGGRTVDLVGPPGIGKSRLLEELAAVSGLPILWVDGDIYSESSPYQPIRRFVREQLGFGPDDSRAAVGDAFQAFVAESAPDMIPWLPLVGRVVDADFPMTPTVADIDLGARKERMEWAISELLGAIVTDPTIVVFNDAHFMDDATVDLLRRLNADVERRPWLMVTSYRPAARAQVPRTTTLIELEPLDEAASEALLAAVTDASPLPLHQVRALAERAHGNPLFLQELAEGVLETGTATELPDSVEGILAARIDRLTPASRRTLRAAAVLGMEVDVSLLGSVIEAEGAEVGSALEQLRQLEDLLEQLDADRLKFRHHLVQEVAYEGLPYRRRAALHAATAVALEERMGSERDDRADLLSLHCFHGSRYEAAWRYSVIAGDRARAQYAYAQAADSYRLALEAAARLGRGCGLDIAPVAEALSDVCFELGEFGAAEASLRRAHALPGMDAEALARLRMKVSLIRETTGHYSAALRWITKGLHALAARDGEDSQRLMGELTVSYARVKYLQGRHQEAAQWASQALSLAEQTGDDQTLALALEYLDHVDLALGQIEAAPRSTRSMAIYQASGDLCGQGRIHNSLGMRAFFLGHWPEALDHYASAADAYRRAGRDWVASVSQANMAEVLSDQGHLEEARALLEGSMRVWRGIHADAEIAFGCYQLGRIAARSGRPEEAFALYTEARSFFHEAGEVGEVVLVDSYTAEGRALAGRWANALAMADDVLARAVAMDGLVASVPLLHRVRADALLHLDRHEEAVAALHASVAAARQRDALQDVALGLAGLLEAGAASDDAEAEVWREERDTLQACLGMVRQGHPDVVSA